MLSVCAKLRRDGFTLDAEFVVTGRTASLLGPSGAGKTTLLHLVAGMESPDEGEIARDGCMLYSTAGRVNLPPERRAIGLVPQEGLLFPHLSVDRNLRYGWRRRPPGERRIEPAVVIDLLDLGPLLGRRPAALSGGERQRVALGRALLASPALLLLDEPLASLDQGLRRRILPYLVAVRDELRIPMLYVTHVVSEALEIGEDVVVLDRGRVLAHGSFHDVLGDPAVFAVARALGIENVIPGEVVGRDEAGGTLIVRAGTALVKVPPADLEPGRRVFVTVGADEVLLSLAAPEGLSARNALPATIEALEEIGDLVLVRLDAGFPLVVEVTPDAVADLELSVGTRLFAVLKTHSLRLMPS